MNEAMMIQGTTLQVKEYKGKRVVTFKDIDTVHQRPIGTANKRFLDNRKRFISCVDFFQLSKDEILSSEFRNLATNNRGITLITETGYLMLTKSFTDDLAWKVQRELIDTYFKVREETIQQTVTVTEPIETQNPELLIRAVEAMSGCLEGNRPYCLNILRHIIPDIDENIARTEVKTETTLVTQNKVFYKQGIKIDRKKLKDEVINKNFSIGKLSSKAGVAYGTIRNTLDGSTNPTQETLDKISNSLGCDSDYFKLRVRRKRSD